MVVLIVVKLVMIIDVEEDSIWCMGFEIILLLCEGNGLMLFCFYFVFGFVW